MTLSKDEYTIKGDSIIIPKNVLERLRDHYQGIVQRKQAQNISLGQLYYLGKATVLTDLLKLFEPLEG